MTNGMRMVCSGVTVLAPSTREDARAVTVRCGARCRDGPVSLERPACLGRGGVC